MTTRRAAIYGGVALLVAWLAAANSFPVREATPGADRARASDVGTQALSAEVQHQATLLHQLVSEAPGPSNSRRNPFAFAPRTAKPKPNLVEATSLGTDAVAPAIAPPPTLLLMGIAEDTQPDGVHRTAIIGGDGDAVFMVKEGETVAGRYRVTKIGADAVELEDLGGKSAVRRLALR